MKRKYFIIVLFVLGLVYTNVDASSIEYNLTIGDDLQFYENIIYKVNKSELKSSENYDFMTSIVNDTIYFDNDENVPYSKTKKLVNGTYIVTLKNSFSSLFFTGERIINECFSKYIYDDDGNILSIKLESPFYCSHRADTITIKIKTELDVKYSNAESINNNEYVWNPKDKDFYLRMTLESPNLNDSLQSDGGTDSFHEEEDIDEITHGEDEDLSFDDKEEKNNNNILLYIIVAPLFIGLLVVVTIILKAKKKDLDQI